MRKIFILFSMLAVTLTAFGKGDSTSVKPFQFSFIYPLSTGGIHSAQNGYLISVNALTGVTGSANGIEVGGISNVNRYHNDGLQVGGICNINGTYNKGIQFAGICNITGENSKGAQFGGISNVTGGKIEGLQVAGIANLSGKGVTGLQAAGITSISGGNTKGMQLSGIGNAADDVEGAQIGGIFNVADNVKGLQLAGIINICDSIDGIPIALLSIVGKNGYRSLNVSTNEVFPMNLTYKIGVRAFYTMFSLGYKPSSAYNMGIGYGVGTNHSIGNKSSLELEAHMYQINRNFWMAQDHFLYTLRLNYAREIWKRFTVYGGPSINLMHTRPGSDAYDMAPSWAESFESQSYDWQYWLGFNAGIRF